MATKQNRVLSRLQSDLKDLFSNPYPGVEVYARDEDFRNLCLVLAPSNGPFVGLRLHFVVELPSTWPREPPRIQSSRQIEHPNVFQSYICSDLLRLYSEIEEKGYTGGYTPAFTLKGLFMQLLSFFSSEEVEQEGGYVVRLGSRFEDAVGYGYTAWGDIQGDITRMAEMHYGDPREYLEELKANGGTERKEEHKDQNGYRYTIWYPHASKKTRCWKVTMENPRYKDTAAQIRGFVCGKCGYGTPNSPCEIDLAPSQVPVHLLFRFERKRIRNLKNKLRDIEALKERQATGEAKLEATQLKKVETYDQILSELNALEAIVEVSSSIISVPGTPFSEPQNLTGMCYFATLNDDVLLTIASELPDESLINLGKAYPRMQALVKDTHILLQRELKCFFLRTPLHHPSNLLGIGVHFNRRDQSLESSFDWLSMDAFELFKVRKSIDKKEFEYFLPLGFSASHFDRAYESGQLFKYLEKLEVVVFGTRKQLKRPILPETRKEKALRVLYKFCNSIVVSLMRATDDLYSGSKSSNAAKDGNGALLFASEKAAIGYLQIYNLILCIYRKDPELRERALTRIKAFCREDVNRTKDATPDLGEFLVMAAAVSGSYIPSKGPHTSPKEPTISPTGPAVPPRKALPDLNSDSPWLMAIKKREKRAALTAALTVPPHRIPNTKVSWSTQLATPFITEVLTRNVKWLLQSQPTLAVLEEHRSPPSYRLRTTFTQSRTSLRLVMFQVFFLETFARPDINLASQYGFPDAEVPGMITGAVREIYAVDGWRFFLLRVGLTEAAAADPESWCGKLREAVRSSAQRGYHRSNAGQALAEQRRRMDPGVVLRPEPVNEPRSGGRR